MRDQRRHVDLPQVPCEVALRKGLDAIELALEATHHALQPEEFPDAFRHGGAITVVAVEGDGQVLEELGAVVDCALADAVTHFNRQTVSSAARRGGKESVRTCRYRGVE